MFSSSLLGACGSSYCFYISSKPYLSYGRRAAEVQHLRSRGKLKPGKAARVDLFPRVPEIRAGAGAKGCKKRELQERQFSSSPVGEFSLTILRQALKPLSGAAP